MCRLVPFVVCSAESNGREQIEAHFSVRFGVFNLFALLGGFQVFRVWFAVSECPRFLAAKDVVEEARI